MFSPREFVREGGTLYLIAESRDDRPSPCAGLFAALVIEIYHQAALAAAEMPGERLDPPMLWALDEVTQTCPLPLPSLLADAGGRGIQIMPVVHGIALLRARWGRDGARTILDACGTKVFLHGGSDPETLEMASRLSGQIAGRERGQWYDYRYPVMTEDMIRQLPVRRDGTGYALILRNGLSPVIGRPPVIWRDRRVKRMLRHPRQAEALPSGTGEPADPALDHAQTDAAWTVSPPISDATPVPWPGTMSDQPPVDQNRGNSSSARARRPWDQMGTQP